MNEEPLVRVEGVSKRFCRGLKRSLWYGVRDIAGEFNPFKRGGATGSPPTSLRRDEFWALNGASFELRRGECLGLIGRNGAGKTTMLKVLNGLIKPDHGHVTMRGRVGAMIALGAGFNPVLTGRENIYVNGSVLGLSNREIDEKIDEIIDFSEVGEFIDMPVQSYSSGMQVRLGFAVASSLSPDILLVDEVLAVGDMIFRSKCFQRIDALRRTAAVILVSHQMDQIGVACSRVLVMDRGQVVCDGSAETGIETYERLNQASGDSANDIRRLAPSLSHANIEVPERFSYGDTFRAILTLHVTEAIPNFYARVRFRGTDAKLALEVVSDQSPVDLPAGHHRIEIRSERLFLRPGPYLISADGFQVSTLEPLFQLSRSTRTTIEGKVVIRGGYVHLPAVLHFDGVPAARATPD